MCNCMVLDVTAMFFWITAFLKKLPFLAKGLVGMKRVKHTKHFPDYLQVQLFIVFGGSHLWLWHIHLPLDAYVIDTHE